ncbi:hypothetical protein [Streptosporangium vulgare]|uniref:hypothetical protein n=1 Tax=Streptosporangium vulgare TaxID=46190 RepID=UPI0031D9A16E
MTTARFSGLTARSGPLTTGQANMVRCMLTDPPEHMNYRVVRAVQPGTTLAVITEAALQLVTRHESLRTTFHDDLQHVLAAGSVAIEVHDTEEPTAGPDTRDAGGSPVSVGDAKSIGRTESVSGTESVGRTESGETGGPEDEGPEGTGDGGAVRTRAETPDTDLAEEVARRLQGTRFALDTEIPLRVAVIASGGVPRQAVLVTTHSAMDAAGLAVLLTEWDDLLLGKPLAPVTAPQPLDVAAGRADPGRPAAGRGGAPLLGGSSARGAPVHADGSGGRRDGLAPPPVARALGPGGQGAGADLRTHRDEPVGGGARGPWRCSPGCGPACGRSSCCPSRRTGSGPSCASTSGRSPRTR